jgi:hypothetical protein
MLTHGKKIQIIKFGIFICSVHSFSSCTWTTKYHQSQVSENKNLIVVNRLDTLKNQFNLFRKCVIENRKIDIKQFFDFPIISDDIWYKVIGEKEVESHLGNAFTEGDFETYFDMIFIKSFKESLSDIDVQQLFDIGKFNTKYAVSKENEYLVTSHIEATNYNNELTLIFRSVIKNKANEFVAEHTEFYIFNIRGNIIKFTTFYMAG